MLAFNTEEDRGDHYGVFEQSYAGWCFVRLHKDQIDLDNGYVCGIPVIEKSSYKEPRISFSDSNISVMHGSKRGIQASHGNRVYEYNYHFFDWLAKRFVNRVLGTGEKMVTIKASRNAFPGYCQADRICESNFTNLAESLIRESLLINVEVRVTQGCVHYDDFGLVYSDLYMFFYEEGQPFEFRRDLHKMVRDMEQADILEKVTRKT